MSIKNFIDETIPVSGEISTQSFGVKLNTSTVYIMPLNVRGEINGEILTLTFSGGTLAANNSPVTCFTAIPWFPKENLLINDVLFQGISRGSMTISNHGNIKMFSGPNLEGVFSSNVLAPHFSISFFKNNFTIN